MTTPSDATSLGSAVASLNSLMNQETTAPDGSLTDANGVHRVGSHDAAGSDPLKTATGVYITVHGHFYQPPRENPYLDAIERQPSASPFHDWNERIHHECYRPNAFARILNDRGEIVGIVNNYEYLSFNIGPTLMSWLERYDVETYQRILEADSKSSERLNGHGNAIAQVYNHIIMPLANERDKYTQIRWGKEDFRSRFGHDPEGMWLAETAVDYITLEALIAEGIKFIVLAPSQAQRCRPLPTAQQPDPEWYEVGGGQIDPTRPYRCIVPSGKSIDIFFYDGPISRDMGFNDVLNSSGHLAGRLGSAIHGDHRPSQLISVATDGETFGHHKGGTEKCLAYAFTQEFPQRGWTVTNYGHYLSINPPAWEVELKPVTAWSCSHGVDRWQEDCGCAGGGGWHQKWRRPLRAALDWLRDQLSEVYETEGRRLLSDPWLARDEYIGVVRNRSLENVEAFLDRHKCRELSPAEQVDTLRLLEMQRHTLLMYTSCGWFFEELSRPEGVQILRYAARAIELAGDVVGVQLEKSFVEMLAFAPSNVDFFKDGAAVYRHLVVTAQITLEQVAAHYAISGLFTTYPEHHRVYCYTTHRQDYQLQRIGPLTLAVGQLQLISEVTQESVQLVFAVLHLGGWDFHCCIQPFQGRREYTQMKDRLFDALQQASAAHVILAMNDYFDGKSFSLRDLFAEERHRIMRLLSQETLMRLDQLYTQVYRDNYGVMAGFQRDELPVPQELQVAAEIAIGHRCLNEMRSLYHEFSDLSSDDGQLGLHHLTELEAIAAEAKHLRCHLNLTEAKTTLEQLILRSLWHLLHDGNLISTEVMIERIERMIDLGIELNLDLSIDRAQELYFYWLHAQIAVGWFTLDEDQMPAGAHCPAWDLNQQRRFLQLGKKLLVEVDGWLTRLP
jgi:alpha-amylase/alpha-mannosidase (GH57 family)